ncbi:MAG: hypothetical protein ACE5HA_10120, partial [Anaerolineae bacterium]
PEHSGVRPLPAEVADLPERVDWRTANSATFEASKGRFTTVMGAEPLHYQDASGAWQVINPAFRTGRESFYVQRNSIRSRAGLRSAWLSAAVGEAAVRWQATTLGAAGIGGGFTELTHALEEALDFAELREGGRVLHYAGGWSDKNLAEEIISAPGSLEHLLILAEPPRSDGTPEFLELQATLELLPGMSLWADGRQQSGAFRTTGALEIHDQAGEVAIIFDPVRAFEQAAPQVAVAGEYAVFRGHQPGQWTVGVRTPWTWWSAAERHYPAVIDPTMHVLQTTGYGNGMAWVSDGTGDTDNPDLDHYQLGRVLLGSTNSSDQYHGYLQFNSLPALLTNHPMKVEQATLVVTPQRQGRVGYEFDPDDDIDWSKVSISRPVRLWAVSQSPADPNRLPLCAWHDLTGTCFTLADGRIGTDPSTHNWNSRPEGVAPYKTGTLTLGPKQGNDRKGEPTSFDVTQEIRDWYNESPRPEHGPAFVLVFGDASCPYSKSWLDANYIPPDDNSVVPRCFRFKITPENAQLQITYTALQLGVGANFLNKPGVPSYLDGIFADTNHQYDLAIPAGFDHWRAAAVRGNHAIEPALPSKIGLKLVDHTGDPVNLVNGTVQEADKTAVVLIDEHNPSNAIEVADLWAEVTASNENDFPSDEGRNYRIEHQRASEWGLPYSAWQTQNILFSTDRLIHLGEFEVATGDDVLIRVSAPVTFPLTIGLAAPTSGSDKADSALGNVNLDKHFEPEGQPIRDKSFTVQTPGKWALALINQGRPILDPNPFTGPVLAHQVVVEILRCHAGEIATDKWDCQPVILPDAGTPKATALGLTVYSEGGFVGDPDSDTWCTTNEGIGTPIIGPDVNGRWVVVGQGSVCRNGDTISTTEDSGIGLAIEIPIPKPFPDGTTRGKLPPPKFVYGSTAHYPLPAGYPTGVVVRAGDSGQLEPQVDTRRNFAPFDEYWGTVFTPGADSISTTEMKAHGEGIINATVTVTPTDPVNLDWDVLWAVYPEETAGYEYVFDVQADQSPALPSPTLLASLQLRILGAGNVATGLIESLDYYKLETIVDAGQFQAGKAKITQDDDLGGATKNIKVVVQPPGFPRLPANEKSCSYLGAATSCLDLRRDDYEWDNGSGDKNVQPWELPDIHIEDSAGLMMFSRPGDLQIFSADHPYAANFDQSFSFDTWGATVSVKEEECTEGGPVVTVVRGSANIALPSVGDDGSGGSGGITVNFKLCQAKLYQAKITLSVPPPGIPAGSTGVGVNLIGGEVTVDPDFTQIELQLGFQTLDGATITGGTGSVLIDTRGLFELQASALIVGVLDADLLLQVAWEPLDVLLQAEVGAFGGLITGALKLHAWVGQGWQGKYYWLPANSDFHFTGSIKATLFIKEDAVIEWLPPFDISRGIKIAFGEFCTNDSCTNYAWGMSAVFTMFGFDVGLYVDEDGPELILGTDDHVLLDEYGGSLQAANVSTRTGDSDRVVSPSSVGPAAPAPPDLTTIEPPGNLQIHLYQPPKSPVDDWPKVAPATHGCDTTSTPLTHVCPFPIAPGAAGRAIFSVFWLNSGMAITLIKPDNTEITGDAPGVVYTQTLSTGGKRVTFAVTPVSGETLEGGTWRLRLVGPGLNFPNATIQHNYSILFATDPPPPTFNWINPVSQVDGSGQITLQWSALRASQPITERLELFYTPLAAKPVTETQIISPTMIANGIHASDGSYLWDTSGLGSGEYAVGARIDDHHHANGHIVSWAPGSVVITDTTPPPAPVVAGDVTLKDALVVVWWRDDTTKDLAGYLIEYTYPSWDNQHLQRVRRLLPTPPWEAIFEQARLGGLLQGYTTTYCVRAYDASGNVSSCTPVTVTVGDPDRPLGPPRNLEAGMVTNPFAGGASLHVVWDPPETGGAAGYLLGYDPIGCQIPGGSHVAEQGLPPIDVGYVHEYDLTGLTDGQRYLISVAAYNGIGYLGPEATTIGMYADPTDGNGDGLSDAWAAIFGVTGTTADPDQDGLTNIEEFNLGTYPTKADSDRDGFDDDVEVEAGTDPCGPEHPPHPIGPKLTLAGQALYKFVTSSNGPSINPQKLQVYNFGAGMLNWTASKSASWITLSDSSGTAPSELLIGVNPKGMAPGRYNGMVTINTSSAAETFGLLTADANSRGETATVEVSVQVLPPRQYSLYLPLLTVRGMTAEPVPTPTSTPTSRLTATSTPSPTVTDTPTA